MISNRRARLLLEKKAEIANKYSTLEDCWNTFQYVSKNALTYTYQQTGSPHHKELKDKLDKLNDILNENIIGLKKVMNTVEDYAENAIAINDGNYQ